MVLTDQQLRQELLRYGENVPPITQRNRAQLHARLDALRAQPRSPVKTSPTRSRTSARSRTGRNLIELSDSEADRSPSGSRASSRSPTRASHVQTRSIAVGRDTDRATPISSKNVTADVEESIARHRREIEQLMHSARERNRSTHTSHSSPRNEPLPPSATPFRPHAGTSRSRSTYKAGLEKPSVPSWLHRAKGEVQTFWQNYKDTIANLLKALIVGSIIGLGLIVLATKGKELIPHPKRITCDPNHATECEDMRPIIDSLRTYLQTRTGEVECGFRPKDERYVTRPEVNKFLDTKGYKFQEGEPARWETLINYILSTPDTEILPWKNDMHPARNWTEAAKLTATEGIYPLVCRIRRNVNSAMHQLAYIALGTTGLLSLAWLLKRRSKQHEENEKTYKDFVNKIFDLLEDQYEQHRQDPETKPWLAISHIRDMLIPPQDRKKLKNLWERARKQISESESRIRAETQLIHGEEYEVWRWIQPRSPSPQRRPQQQQRAESPSNTHEESYVYMPPDVGLTQCLKLRNFFDSNTAADDDEIDLVVDSIQSRCATVRRIEHIGIHAIYVYLKFSSKEAAAQGFHLLNNWKYHGREIIAKYLRLERYHEHFPEARDSGASS